MKIIQTPAQLTSYRQKADRSMTLSFSTREYSPDEIQPIAELFQSDGWLLFKPDSPFSEEELPKNDSGIESKTPSQRMRSVLFVWWKQKNDAGETNLDFDAFYRAKMERIIDQVKEKLTN